MNGFFAIFSKKGEILDPLSPQWKKPFDFQPEFTLRNSKNRLYFIEQYTSTKFINEKLWIENADYICVTEGIIHNLIDLCSENNVKNAETLFYKYVNDENITFFKNFKGNFSGILFNKRTNKVIVFNNQTGTKKIFYFDNSDYLILSSELSVLSKSLTFLKIPFSLDIESSYLLLTSGFMHENKTLINEVKQIRAGEFAIHESKQLHLKNYFHLAEIQETNDTKTDIIQKLNYLFEEAIKLEFEVDSRNKFNHLSTLSGGLDSRMTALVANKMGFENQCFFNFSEKGYADEIIAKKIAQKYKKDILQITIENASLTYIDEVCLVNDGLIIYTGASHVFSSIQKIETNKLGIVHTGLLGDAVMGSYLSNKTEQKPQINQGVYSDQLLNKARIILEKSMSEYKNEELYKFYNRGFMGMNNGALYFDLIGETSSPFMNPNFLAYAKSIPYNYKYKENIYIEWIKTLHPEIANFTWENIGGKPTNNTYLRSFYKYRRAIIKRLPLQTMWKNNMNPEQIWYDNNPIVKAKLDTYFTDNLYRLDNYKELQSDIIDLYNKGKITEKTQVLTLLAAIKLLFDEK